MSPDRSCPQKTTLPISSSPGGVTRLIGWAALSLLVALTFAPAAQATTRLEFASSEGSFSIAEDVLDFGDGLTVSGASVEGVEDGALIGAMVSLTPLQLTGFTTNLPGGLTRIEIDSSVVYEIQIFRSMEDGGALLLSGRYDPGEFLAIGASGLISASIADDIFRVSMMVGAAGFSDVLEVLASTADAIDFNLTLSAAGQDIAALIEAGAGVSGSVAGTVATVIPEPSTAVMLGLGLGVLALVTRHD